MFAYRYRYSKNLKTYKEYACGRKEGYWRRFDSSFGYNNQTIKNVIFTFQKQNNIDGQDDEILDNIHNSNLNYLRQLGQNIFSKNCLDNIII